jgi:uncharacterized membrane protein
VLAIGAGLGFFGLAWLRFAGLHSQAFDLAFFDQVVWNASEGHGFVSSFTAYPFFGQHFSPALAAFVPLYAIKPSPLWLLLAQSLALGLAVLPLHALASAWLSRELAVLAAAAYLLQLFVWRAVEFDFHTEALAVPFIFWALLGAHRGQRWTLLLAGSVAMLCKEDGALVSFGIGFLALAVSRRREGVILMLASLVYAAAVTALIMPAIRGGAASDIVLRYGYLGSTVAEIASGFVHKPGPVATHLFNPNALLLTFGGLAFLPLLRPIAVVAALPPLLLALLSDARDQHQLLYQYGLQPGPLLVVAALLGWQRLTARRPAGWVLLGAAAAVLVLAAPRPHLYGLARQGDAQAVLAQVPAGAAVEASRNLLPLLSEREEIAQFPAYREEWLVLDEHGDFYSRAAAPTDHGYRLVYRSGDFSVWRR